MKTSKSMNSPYKRPRFWFQLRKGDEHQQDTLSGWSVFWLCCLLNSWNKRTLLIFYLLLWGVNNFWVTWPDLNLKKRVLQSKKRCDKIRRMVSLLLLRECTVLTSIEWKLPNTVSLQSKTTNIQDTSSTRELLGANLVAVNVNFYFYLLFFIFINFKHVLTCRKEPVEKPCPTTETFQSW